MSTVTCRFLVLEQRTRACKFGYLSSGNATSGQLPLTFALARWPNAQTSRRMLMQCSTTALSAHLNRFPTLHLTSGLH
jgi:hypothetical protein